MNELVFVRRRVLVNLERSRAVRLRRLMAAASLAVVDPDELVVVR